MKRFSVGILLWWMVSGIPLAPAVAEEGREGGYRLYEATAATAVDDLYAVVESELLTVAAPGVVGNDSDVEGDTLTATKTSDPAFGALTLNGDGSFEYEPHENFNGTDFFVYQAQDATVQNNSDLKFLVGDVANLLADRH